MDVKVTVIINVESCEDEFDVDLINAEDPLLARIVNSVEEAVTNALHRDQDNGFSHDMEDELALCILSVSAEDDTVDPKSGV